MGDRAYPTDLMNPSAPRLGPRLIPLLAALICPVWAVAQTDLNDPLARAQRAVDRVKEIIRESASYGTTSRTTTPAPVAKPAVQARPKASRPRVDPAAILTAVQPATTTSPPLDTASSTPTQGPATPAPAEVILPPVTVKAKPPVVSLFDFENTATGFSLHDYANWDALPAKHISLTQVAQHGQQALQATSSKRSWLSVDLDDSVDFSGLLKISFWLHNERGTPVTFALKSGTQFDWCMLSLTASTPSGFFTRYEASLASPKGDKCRHLDLSDVRGIYWEVGANEPLILDNVELL